MQHSEQWLMVGAQAARSFMKDTIGTTGRPGNGGTVEGEQGRPGTRRPDQGPQADGRMQLEAPMWEGLARHQRRDGVQPWAGSGQQGTVTGLQEGGLGGQHPGHQWTPSTQTVLGREEHRALCRPNPPSTTWPL